jgi:hypothetical protein
MESILEPHAVYENVKITNEEAAEAHLEKLACIQLWDARGRMDYKLGEKLHVIESLYEFQPGKAAAKYGFDTYRQLIEAPRESGGLDIVYSSSSRAIRIYTLMVRCGIDEKDVEGIDYSKLDILNKIMTPENCDEWLNKARVLSRADLKKELGETDRPQITTHRRLADMDSHELRNVIQALRRYIREQFIKNPKYKEPGRILLSQLQTLVDFE